MILFSHGFGVQKDDRGLFTDIAPHLSDEYRMFDYNSWDEQARKLRVTPIDVQVELLLGELSKLEEPVDLICHSQGCVIAALAQPQNIRSVIFLAPAATRTADELATLFSKNGASVYNRTGTSVLQRSDGSQTLVPPEYWDSLDNVGDTYTLYQRFSQITNLTIITAVEEEIVAQVDYSGIKNVTLGSITGADHNFTGDSRQKVVEAVASLLN